MGGIDMVTTHSITTATAYYEKSVQSKKENTVKTNNTQTVKSSEEELIEKIGNIDWNKVSGKTVGVRFDFFV